MFAVGHRRVKEKLEKMNIDNTSREFYIKR